MSAPRPLTDDSLAAIRQRAADWVCTMDDPIDLLAHIDYCASVLNAPEVEDFLMGVQLESAHQQERWGSDHDAGKGPQDWFWLIGYLAGKALRSAIDGDRVKLQHHCISTAAVLANWHRHALGKSRMRPGIEDPA